MTGGGDGGNGCDEDDDCSLPTSNSVAKKKSSYSSAISSFTVHFAHRQLKWRRRRRCHQRSNDGGTGYRLSNKLLQSSRTFSSTEPRIIRQWYETLRIQLANQVHRPRRLLLFINPFGGRQQAARVYDRWAAPLFQLAGIQTRVIVSQRANHIRDLIAAADASADRLHDAYDGLVCIGGDGTFAELFNGLIVGASNRSSLETPTIPIGVIPAGSTDTVAYCLHGTTDVLTACIHIVLGQRSGLDLSSITATTPAADANGQHGSMLRLYASVMSYGYLGDVAADSEKFRWLGPRRYDWSGFKAFIANRGYDAEISIPNGGTDTNNDEDSMAGPKCYENCERCSMAVSTFKLNKSVISDDGDNGDDEDVNGDDIDDGKSAAKWRTICGRFFMINGANISCACQRSPNGFSEFCHLGDGCVDLVLVRHTTFFNNVRLLLKLASRNGRIVRIFFSFLCSLNIFQ